MPIILKMAKSKKKRKSNPAVQKTIKSANFLALALIILVVLGILAFGLSIFNKSEFEITKNDVLANKVNSKDIEFYGIKLGDSIDKVRSKMGKPDYENRYQGNVINLEYEYDSSVGLLFHVESGIITSVTVKESFNKHLVGATMIQYSKEDMLRKFGAADNVESIYPYRVYTYNDLGVKFIIDRDQENGMIFFL